MSWRDFLVLERTPIGHRANYARTVAVILDATCRIGFSPRVMLDALKVRHLVITTFESAPARYLGLMVLRSLTGRRSTVIITRSHVPATGRKLRAKLKAVGHGVMTRLSLVQRLTITPPVDPLALNAATYIEDIEFWDLPEAVLSEPNETPLSARAVQIAGSRPIILVTGTLERSKGLLFLGAVLKSRPALHERFAVICCGLVEPADRAVLAELASNVDLWEDRYLDNDEIYSLYSAATAVWCCYDISYDVSSGVFGRAVQFARPTIVRAGSIIDRLQDRLSNGLKLDYGDAMGSARQLLTWTPAAGIPISRYHGGAERLRKLVHSHAGVVERGER